MTRKTFTMHNAQQAMSLLTERVYAYAKPLLLAGHKLTVTVSPETRRTGQNARLHAMLGDIARQLEWAGAKRDPEVWKRGLMAAWLRARGENVLILPALDGNGIDVVFRHTSDLSVGECAEFIDYLDAWGSQAGVEWSEPIHEPA